MKIHYGFSLIELMIVVAIISILSALAIPSYLDYTKRARFTEVITLTQPYKVAITLALQQGIPLADLKNGQHGIPSSLATRNLNSIIVDQGTIIATASNKLKGLNYILTPNPENNTWQVSGSCLNADLCEA